MILHRFSAITSKESGLFKLLQLVLEHYDCLSGILLCFVSVLRCGSDFTYVFLVNSICISQKVWWSCFLFAVDFLPVQILSNGFSAIFKYETHFFTHCMCSFSYFSSDAKC